MGYNDKFYRAPNNYPSTLHAVLVHQLRNMSKLDKTDIAPPKKDLGLSDKAVLVPVML
jgi:hypothetical protein